LQIDPKPILEIEDLTHIYGEGTPFRHIALEHISLKVTQGELIGIIGHTGSGKSTLIQHFNGLLKPTSGRVLLKGTDIFRSKVHTRSARFTVGLVMQYPEYQLFEETVRKDIEFGPRNKGLSGDLLNDAVERAAEAVGLSPDQMDASPFDLSGGEKRRVAIAGILAMDPEILVLDEPTAGLDPHMRKEVLSIIKRQHELGKTVLFVSHSMDIVADICQRILVMNKSQIIMDDTPEKIFARADELKSVGLALPELTEIFEYMHKNGLRMDKAVYTMNYAVKKLNEYIERGE